MQSNAALQALKCPFWATHRARAEAVRALTDPALAWLPQHGPFCQDHVAAVENAALCTVHLATQFPCATPSVCDDADELQAPCQRQGE